MGATVTLANIKCKTNQVVIAETAQPSSEPSQLDTWCSAGPGRSPECGDPVTWPCHPQPAVTSTPRHRLRTVTIGRRRRHSRTLPPPPPGRGTSRLFCKTPGAQFLVQCYIPDDVGDDGVQVIVRIHFIRRKERTLKHFPHCLFGVCG